MAAVRFSHIAKQFGTTTAVSDFDVSIRDGEFFVLLGPSGCGKSTVLRILAGLEDATGGTVHIGEREVTTVSPKDRDIAMVFQSYALYPHMTVRKNIEFPLRARGVPSVQREPAIQEAARALDLLDYLDRKPSQLSGGQRQRVALARAIVRKPQVFLMDEPLSNLDAKLRGRTRSELIELQRRLGVTTVYVTHDQVEAMTMGHRIAVMNDGVLQQVGAPQEVYDRPSNAFVARFIGNPPMNVLNAQFTGSALELGGATIPGVNVPHALPAGPISFGVRAEHLAFADDGIPATISMVEELGHERHVTCRLDDGQALVVRVEHGQSVPPLASATHLACLPEHVHLFAADSGDRIE
jgi:multiple sugar transport system ATP-binding protein